MDSFGSRIPMISYIVTMPIFGHIPYVLHICGCKTQRLCFLQISNFVIPKVILQLVIC